ncbi:MAG: hypothetical protein IKW97_06650 [Muribaculaceae bacterium]|nr:hypothetical protein [Muribaculaceae bacterium]
MKKTVLLLLMLVAMITAQAATSYNFYVGGVLVTSDNCSNITGSNITGGTAVFTPSNNTLTLTNVTITRTGTDNRAIQSDRSGLIVKLVGTNKLSASSSSVIRFNQPGSIVVASGTTTVTGGSEGGIYSNNVAVTVSGPGTLNVSSTSDKYGFEGKGTSSSSTLTFSNITATVSGKKGALYDWSSVTFNTGSNITLKATSSSSYPVAWHLGGMSFGTNTAIVIPDGATYNSSSQAIVNSSGTSIWSTDIAIAGDIAVALNSANFPDANFRSYMRSLYTKGYLNQTDINNCTTLSIDSRLIGNLTGIEWLSALQRLYCSYNALTSVDLSHNTNLVYVDLRNNKLTSLNVSALSALENLYCGSNQLTSLRLPAKSSPLHTIEINDNRFATLTLTGRTNLVKLNVSNNTLLYTLDCNDNDNLTTLYLTGCTALTTLNCYNNNILSVLNTTGLTALNYIDCRSNCFNSLNVSGLTALEYLYCSDNYLSSLTLPSATSSSLKILDVSYNSFTSLSVTGHSKLKTLSVQANPALTSLFCYNNALTSLDVAADDQLTDLRCYNNPGLSSISGLGGCTAITYFDCSNCAIGSLTACNTMEDLVELHCKNNKISSLNITYKDHLTKVDASGNTLMSNADLTYNNALETLNLSNCTTLTTILCYNSALTSLSVAGCNALTRLDCYTNRLADAAMTTLIGDLPMRSSTDPGTFKVLYSTQDNNVFTAAHLAAAQAKYWMPMKWSNWEWVDITFSIRGDVNGDGSVNISDVTTLIDLLLGNGSTSEAADVNGDGSVNISDVTALIDLLLSSN